MVATGQKMVREKKSPRSGNSTLRQAKFLSSRKVREN